MKKVRRFLSLLLIVCMIVTFAPAAFADDPTAEAEAGTTKDDTNPAEVKVDGDVDNAKAEAKNGGEASFEVGSITDTDGYTSVQVTAEAGSSQTSENATHAEGTVDGDISVSTDTPSTSATGAVVTAKDEGAPQNVEAVLKTEGEISATSTHDNATALKVEANGEKATAVVDVGEGVSAEGQDYSGGIEGIKASAENKGAVDIEIIGAVNATLKDSGPAGEGAQGLDLSAKTGGSIEVDVGGVVTAVSEKDTMPAQGIVAAADGENSKIEISVGGVDAKGGTETAYPCTVGAQLEAENGGTTTLKVGEEGINAAGGEGTVGAALNASEGSTVKLESYGDLKAEGDKSIGIVLGGNGSVPSTTEVFVDGIVSGEETSIQLMSSTMADSDVSMTIWEADVVDDKVVAVNAGAGEEREKTAAAIEANIQYIIRAEQEGNGAHNDYTGLSVSGATQVNGYYAATEATDVTLKAFEGYRIVSMEGSNDATKSVLTQDSDGVYHILIPKGGGMWINVKMEKIEPAPAPAPEPAPAPAADSGYDYVVFVLGTITAGDGSILTIYSNRNYTVDYADGAKEKGVYKFVYDGQLLPDGSGEKGSYRWLNDGLLIFTSSEQEVRTPEMDEDTGDATYTFRSNTQFLIESDIVSMIRAGRKFADIHISAK